MVDQFLKNYSVVIQEKLYEEKSQSGHICVYQTTPFGITLTVNEQVVLTESDSFILHEMMVHPALFTHPNPKRVVIIGHHYGVLHELVKHHNIKEINCLHPYTHLEAIIKRFFKSALKQVTDERIREHNDWQSFTNSCDKEKVDVIIFTETSNNLPDIITLLAEDGIIVHPALPSLIHLQTLKKLFNKLKEYGFKDCQSLNFPQPSAAAGWRTIVMATKRAGFKRVREADVFNRAFNTRFYNFDMHKAATVLPEFMREELGL